MTTAPAPAGERSKDMVFLHVQLEDGETARVYVWDKISATFRSRWNDSEAKPPVLLLTTLSSKTVGDGERPPTVNSSSAAVTKVETVTLDEVYKFLQNESPLAGENGSNEEVVIATPQCILDMWGARVTSK
ncbi:hypothetical protein DY000_02025164 [Brassica cretica]|uniref:Uncharacterized protein n=1 Tax=Brassica cretica TaxID=69181 RepID=A0ABQ7E4Z4_BRACR|nr:hypothetical protein DY000_02025164 [Brassica cretica]